MSGPLFCCRCGTYVNMELDIFGRESDEGRMVDDEVVCAACLEKEEAGE